MQIVIISFSVTIRINGHIILFVINSVHHMRHVKLMKSVVLLIIAGMHLKKIEEMFHPLEDACLFILKKMAQGLVGTQRVSMRQTPRL